MQDPHLSVPPRSAIGASGWLFELLGNVPSLELLATGRYQLSSVWSPGQGGDHPECPKVHTIHPLLTSHTRTLWSCPPDASIAPSWDQDSTLTGPSCPDPTNTRS